MTLEHYFLLTVKLDQTEDNLVPLTCLSIYSPRFGKLLGLKKMKVRVFLQHFYCLHFEEANLWLLLQDLSRHVHPDFQTEEELLLLSILISPEVLVHPHISRVKILRIRFWSLQPVIYLVGTVGQKYCGPVT